MHRLNGGGTSRLIPARAGNTHCGHCPDSPYAAHPRSRGEHLGSALVVLALYGSSPLARGPLWLTVFQAFGEGLIPARAGTTF